MKTLAEMIAGNDPAPDSLCVTLDGLAHDGCRWPLGDPREASFRYCGAPALRDQFGNLHSYCAFHRALGVSGTARVARPNGSRPGIHLTKGCAQ